MPSNKKYKTKKKYKKRSKKQYSRKNIKSRKKYNKKKHHKGGSGEIERVTINKYGAYCNDVCQMEQKRQKIIELLKGLVTPFQT